VPLSVLQANADAAPADNFSGSDKGQLAVTRPRLTIRAG
jgi:hypothetical protein